MLSRPTDLSQVERARRDFGDAIVALAMMQLPVLVSLSMGTSSNEGKVFWSTVVALGTALTLGRTAFLYGAALRWSRWQCWLTALVCGGVQIAAWMLYFWLASRPVESRLPDDARSGEPPDTLR